MIGLSWIFTGRQHEKFRDPDSSDAPCVFISAILCPCALRNRAKRAQWAKCQISRPPSLPGLSWDRWTMRPTATAPRPMASPAAERHRRAPEPRAAANLGSPLHPIRLRLWFFFVNSGNAPNFEHVHFGTCRIYPYLTLVEFETCLEPGETTIKRYLQVQIMEDGLGEDPLLAACAALPSPANDLQMAGSSWRCFQWCLTWTKARKEIYARKRFVKWTHLHPEQPKWIMPSDLSLKEGAEVHCCSSCNANSMPNQNEARTTRRVSLPKENSYSVAFSGFRGIDSSTALFYTNTEISSSITSRSSEVTHQIRPKLKAQTRRLSPGHSSASPPRAMASAKSKAFLGGHPKILGLRTSKDQALDINWRVDDPWWSLMITVPTGSTVIFTRHFKDSAQRYTGELKCSSLWRPWDKPGRKAQVLSFQSRLWIVVVVV